ncbi:hypothetical protein FQR65_LT16670 [Abscondita terminalis]|nr:hypothetical protein FQR65_LT16670 [Abscondita terminalis]
MGLFGKKPKELEIFAPVDGTLIELSAIKDEVFAEGMMGDGFGIDPENGEFVSPVDGELATVFPTGHAYGFQTKVGVEILMHIGLDTVSLKGEGFDVKVSQGEKVTVGTPLVNIDIATVSKKVPSMQTPFVFTSQGTTFEMKATGKVKKDVTKKFIKTNIFESKEDFDNKYNKLKNKFETENSLTIYNKYDFEQVVEEQDFYFEIIFSDSFEEIDLLEVQIKTLEPIEGVMANGRMITDEDKVKFDIANQGLTVKTNNLVLNNDGNTIDLEIKNFDN